MIKLVVTYTVSDQETYNFVINEPVIYESKEKFENDFLNFLTHYIESIQGKGRRYDVDFKIWGKRFDYMNFIQPRVYGKNTEWQYDYDLPEVNTLEEWFDKNA